MIKRYLIPIFLFLSTTNLFAQNCDCMSNFKWMKGTIEENDAGFQSVIESKGKQSYNEHNNRILKKIEITNTLIDCETVLNEWLGFFRSGHIGIYLNDELAEYNTNNSETQFNNWQTYEVKTDDFKKYLDKKETIDYEGIWKTGPYTIGIKKSNDEYIGFIIESNVDTWTEGQVKLRFNITENKNNSVFYMFNRSAVESDKVTLTENDFLQIGNINLLRTYPKVENNPKYTQYSKTLNAEEAYIEELNKTTLYLRIPSFDISEKKNIDNLLKAYNDKILSTENLIIDIRNNGGGSDISYSSIIPYLYTNPIRTVGVEFLSTKLNNKTMLNDIINDPDFDEETKNSTKNDFEKLEEKRGEFVNLNERTVYEKKLDTIYAFPKNIGIIINENNGSTAEQFLLAAKQSKKVKLFGVTTFGSLDISNMLFVESPCKEFELGYSRSRSMRIPDFTIDEKGIQPDFLLDKSIPQYEWVDYVNDILNNK